VSADILVRSGVVTFTVACASRVVGGRRSAHLIVAHVVVIQETLELVII